MLWIWLSFSFSIKQLRNFKRRRKQQTIAIAIAMVFSTKEIPSPQSLFSAYASMAASLMLFRSLANDFIPNPIRSYLIAGLRYLFKSRSPLLTLIIEESNGISPNQVYEAAEMYLCTKINPTTERLRISKTPKEKNLTIRLEKGEKIVDVFDGIELHWSFVCVEQDKNNNPNVQFPTLARSEKRFFQLSFNKKHQEKVLGFYIPFILEKAMEIRNEERVLKMYTMNRSDCFSGKWESVNLEHPAKFETLAMESEVKSAVIDDLNRFLKRKEFYKRVGKAWKRGYLLYGPPGTGKSSLIAAMANYLKFDIYDLQLGNVMHDSDLRKLLLKTGNRSILVIEDIDCSVELPDRRIGDRPKHPGEVQLTLSGLLNFIDGLWSSCGDERIIVFTTNHKDRLDPALLRPGRMDMHIHMSYCTFHGFKLLANNYLQIHDSHYLFSEIENLLGETEVTPAQVAEELMKSEDAEVSLEGLIKLLKRKKMEDVNGDGDGEREGEGEGEFRELKRLKILNKSKKFAAKITRRKCIRGRRI